MDFQAILLEPIFEQEMLKDLSVVDNSCTEPHISKATKMASHNANNLPRENLSELTNCIPHQYNLFEAKTTDFHNPNIIIPTETSSLDTLLPQSTDLDKLSNFGLLNQSTDQYILPNTNTTSFFPSQAIPLNRNETSAILRCEPHNSIHSNTQLSQTTASGQLTLGLIDLDTPISMFEQNKVYPNTLTELLGDDDLRRLVEDLPDETGIDLIQSLPASSCQCKTTQDSGNFSSWCLTACTTHEKRELPIPSKNNTDHITPISKKSDVTQLVPGKTKATQDIPRTRSQRRKKPSTNIIKWIYDLLCKEEQLYNDVVKWTNRSKLEFRIEKQHKLAGLWGQLKNNPKMNFNKFA